MTFHTSKIDGELENILKMVRNTSQFVYRLTIMGIVIERLINYLFVILSHHSSIFFNNITHRLLPKNIIIIYILVILAGRYFILLANSHIIICKT